MFTESKPIMETISPSIPAIQPLIWDSVDVMVPHIRIPKIERRKNSQDVNLSASFVRTGVRVITKMTLRNVPRKLEVVARKIASPPRPCFAIGCPSRAVAADAGVPGLFKRIADWQPPDIAPT